MGRHEGRTAHRWNRHCRCVATNGQWRMVKWDHLELWLPVHDIYAVSLLWVSDFRWIYHDYRHVYELVHNSGRSKQPTGVSNDTFYHLCLHNPQSGIHIKTNVVMQFFWLNNSIGKAYYDFSDFNWKLSACRTFSLQLDVMISAGIQRTSSCCLSGISVWLHSSTTFLHSSTTCLHSSTTDLHCSTNGLHYSTTCLYRWKNRSRMKNLSVQRKRHTAIHLSKSITCKRIAFELLHVFLRKKINTAEN